MIANSGTANFVQQFAGVRRTAGGAIRGQLSRLITVGIGIGLALFGGASLWFSQSVHGSQSDACEIGLCDPEMEKDVAHLLDISGAADPRQVLSGYKTLLSQDPGSPFNWSKLAFAFLGQATGRKPTSA